MPWYNNHKNDRLWYEDQGNGPVIVLLHGWCMSSVVWQPQMESLSRSFRVIAPDLRGHGKSAPAGDGYRLEDFAADIVSLFRCLDLKDSLLVGWSLGAQVVLRAFEQLRGQLAGLALVAGTPRFIAANDFPCALERFEADGMALRIQRNTALALKGFVASMFVDGEIDNHELADKIYSLLAMVPVPETAVALQCLETLKESDTRHLLESVDLPALVVNGDQDVICLPEASRYLAGCLVNCCQVEMPGCGHAPFLTRSHQFADALTGFRWRISENSG